MNKNKNMIRLILEQEKKISLKYRNQSLYQARNKMYKNKAHILKFTYTFKNNFNK